MATKLLASIRPVLWPLLLCHLPSISSKSAHFEVIEKHTDPFCKWGRVILFGTLHAHNPQVSQPTRPPKGPEPEVCSFAQKADE